MTPLASPVSILCALLGTLPVSALFSDADCHPPRLEMSVTVNGRPASPDPLIRSGGEVRVVYRVTNDNDRDMEDVHLAAALGEAIVCPSGGADVPELEEHDSVVCTATFSAAAGSHDGTVTATGNAGHWWPFDDSDWDRSVSTSAPVGYRGISSLITATDSVTVTPTATGGRATFAYTVTNTGNVPVYDFSLSDPLVPAGGITCTGTSSGLAPGAVAHCGAVVDLAPGPHRSTLSVSASDRTSTAGGDAAEELAAAELEVPVQLDRVLRDVGETAGPARRSR
ncbi:DUF7507 domain-containing protein, partial [Catenulispora rubra]|uniref:DUF7507 domain-containing protein n=1 Tax=Catenulispora rubra TaxID=280293 RepID=UPI001891FE9B